MSFAEAAATYDPLASEYAARYSYHLNDIAIFLDKANIQPGETVLDLGTGIGWVALQARQRTQARIVGIDASKEMVKEAKRVVQQQNMSVPVAFMTGNMITMEGLDGIKPPGGFDVITCLWAFTHVEESQQIGMLRRWKDFLAPTGRIVLDIPHPHHLVAGLTVYNQQGEMLLQSKIHDAQLLEECKVASQAIMTQAGLQLIGVLEQQGVHGYPDHTAFLPAFVQKEWNQRVEDLTPERLEEAKWAALRAVISINVEANQGCLGLSLIHI